MPDNEYRKPYFAEIYGKTPQKRYYVYPREDLREYPVFPYIVLDGGAFLFATDRLGNADSETLLEKTMSGELFDLLRDENGKIDWGRSYHLSEKTGMPKQHEWQSWPQRLYMLLPIAQAYMKTGEKQYADKWLEIVRDWINYAPYEPLDFDRPHISTSMRWRDMQVSWRTVTLLHSLYLLGTRDEAFTKDEWREIYAFLELNLDHLAPEAEKCLEASLLGNHTLQMGSALLTAGVIFAEYPRAAVYEDCGRRVLTACFADKVLPDGGTREVGPSYNHFIARLYLEPEKNCELNGYAEIEGLHASLIRQYQWLANVANRAGRTLRLNDAYEMDAHEDVRRMAKLIPFEPDFSKPSVHMPDSEYILLRNARWELAVDAMKFYGGHEHYGRIQPLLWADGEEVLTDTGCVNYDRGDLYVWGMTAEAHSVVTTDALPLYKSTYDVEVLKVDLAANTVTARVTVRFEKRSYVWTREIRLLEDGAVFRDSVESSEPMLFKGRWYLSCRPTALERGDVLTGSDIIGADHIEEGYRARQALKNGGMVLDCTEKLRLDRTPAMDEENRLTYLERLTWEKCADEFCVETRIRY